MNLLVNYYYYLNLNMVLCHQGPRAAGVTVTGDK